MNYRGPWSGSRIYVRAIKHLRLSTGAIMYQIGEAVVTARNSQTAIETIESMIERAGDFTAS